jgi:high-affinity iron transporter
VGAVLVVMIGGTALSFQDLGWLPRHPLPFDLPVWVGSWLEIYPTYETIGCQALAAGLVIGSYYLARYLRVNRARRQGRAVAQRADAPPSPLAAVELS